MSKNKKKTHIHKYQLVKWGKKKTMIWKCVLENCTHYLHPEMIEGKESLCHECDSKFTLTKEALKRVHPKCPSCRGEATIVVEPQVETGDFNDLLDRLHSDD